MKADFSSALETQTVRLREEQNNQSAQNLPIAAKLAELLERIPPSCAQPFLQALLLSASLLSAHGHLPRGIPVLE